MKKSEKKLREVIPIKVPSTAKVGLTKGLGREMVCVMALRGGSLELLQTFKESPAGNKKAEALFSKHAKGIGAKPKDVNSYLDDGYFETETGYQQVFLVHTPMGG